MTSWHYADVALERHGPVSAEAVRTLFAQQQLSAQSLLWHEGSTGWQPLSAYARGLGLDDLHPTASQDSDSAAETGDAAAPVATTWDADASPYSAPQGVVRQVEYLVTDGHIVYAGFWKRAAAEVLDIGLSWFLGTLPSLAIAIVMVIRLDVQGVDSLAYRAMQGLSWALNLLLIVVYYAWFHASASQATPGKMAVGIKLARTDGRRVGFWRALGRFLAVWLSGLLLLSGLLMVPFTPRKQGLHDYLCDTVVVDRWAWTAHPDWQRPGLGAVAGCLLALGVLVLVLLVAAMAYMAGWRAPWAG